MSDSVHGTRVWWKDYGRSVLWSTGPFLDGDAGYERSGVVPASIWARYVETGDEDVIDRYLCGHAIDVVCDVWTVNAERRMHWRERNDLTQRARAAAAVLARQAKMPNLGRVSIVAYPRQGPFGPVADPGAHEPVIKAVVDGLRDAGVLTDDTKEYVRAIDSQPPVKVKKGHTGVLLVLTPVALAD